MLEMAKVPPNPLPTPAAPYDGDAEKKPSLMEVAKKPLKEVAKGQARRNPGLVAFLCSRGHFPGPTATPPWHRLKTRGVLVLRLLIEHNM